MISEESGSIIPFGLGIISLTAVIALVLVELIGVQCQTLQNKQLADVLVLKVAKDFKADGIAPIVGLDFRPVVSEILHASSSHLRVGVADLSVGSRDGKTIEALVCSEWVSITGFSLGSFGQVCANSKARAIS